MYNETDIQRPLLQNSWVSQVVLGFPVPALPASARDVRDAGSIPGSGRFPGGWYSNPLLYSHLENPTDRGAWLAVVRWYTHDWSDLVHTCRRHRRRRFDPRVGMIPWIENGNPLRYSCLENLMDREICWATIHRATKSQMRLSTHTPKLNCWSFLLNVASAEC